MMHRIRIALSIVFGVGCLACSGPSAHAEADRMIWIERSTGLPTTQINSIGISPIDNDLIFCAGQNTIYRSLNQGSFWERVFTVGTKETIETPPSDERRMDEDEDAETLKDQWDEDDLRRQGILQDDESLDDLSEDDLRERLEDAGLLESEDDSGDPADVRPAETISLTSYFIDIACDPTSDSRVFAATSRNIYRSTDKGLRWTVAWAVTGDTSIGITALAITRPNGVIVVAAGDKIYVSYDQGIIFSPLPDFMAHEPIVGLKSDRYSEDSFFAATPKSLVRVQLPDRFYTLPIVPGIFTDEIRTLAISEGSRIAVLTDASIFLFTPENDWEQILPVDLRSARIFDSIFHDGRLYVATDRGVFSVDAGSKTGAFQNSGLWDLKVHALAAGTEDASSRLWAATGSGMFQWTFETELPVSHYPAEYLTAKKLLPAYTEVAMAALSYAGLDEIYSRRFLHASQNTVWWPAIQFDIKARTDNDSSYDRSRTISLSSGNAYIAPDDQSYGLPDSTLYQFQIRLTWYPQVFKSSSDQLSVSKAFRAEMKKRNEILSELQRIYFEYANRAGMKSPSLFEGISSSLELEYLKARLDGLSGFYISSMETQTEANQ